VIRADPAGVLLALLLAGHLLADFAFQTAGMVRDKGRATGIAAHGLEVLAVQALAALPFLASPGVVLLIAATVVHLAIDRVKAAFAADPADAGPFVADQAAHLATLLVAWRAWTAWPGALPATLDPGWTAYAAVLVALGALAFCRTGGSALVEGVLRRHRLEGAPVADAEEASRGRTIGILERWILLVLVVVGQWSALGLVLAAKSIARFKELEDKDFSERYLIGTLTSVLVAVAAGLALRSVLAGLGAWP